MKSIRITAVFLISFLTMTFALTADPFNKNLTDEERKTLENGEVLIKNIDSIKDISINETPETEKTLSIMKDLKPKYIAEIIQIRPYKGNEDLLNTVNTLLVNISDYAGIPYYSERVEKWYDLYSAAEIVNAVKDGDKTKIDASLTMKPFGTFSAKIEIEEGADSYFYTMKNMEKLVYLEKFTAVGAEKMKSCICIFRDGDNWVLYSIGGVNAFKIFFLEERIETSFINRIKSFCNFIFTKI